MEKIALIAELYRTFQHGIRSGKAQVPRAYLKQLGLDYLTLNLGFNSGQFHHRQPLAYKQQYAGIGILTLNEKVGVNKKGRVPYTCFGAYSIVYPLKNEQGEIVNLYADRFKLDRPKQSYLYPHEGIFPHYPNVHTTTLYLCDNILETASFIQLNLLKHQEAVISLFDGKLTPEIQRALSQLSHLNKVVVFTINPSNKTIAQLKEQFPTLDVHLHSTQKKNVNNYLKNQEHTAFRELLDSTTKEHPITNKQNTSQEKDPSHQSHEIKDLNLQSPDSSETTLRVVNGQKLRYEGKGATYEIVGNLSMDLGQLRVSLRIIHPQTKQIHRTKIDLFEHSDIQTKLHHLPSAYNTNQVEADLIALTKKLEAYRDEQYQTEINTQLSEFPQPHELTPKAKEEAVYFLQQPHLLKRIDELIEASGIIGEENTRQIAFVIASSYKMPYPLHGLIQASSGKGKSHLINHIASLMPGEDVINLSRITSRSLYNYGQDDLMNKLILIQDEDGLDEESLYAFRELQSAGFLSSSTSSKNNFGKHQSRVTRVNAHFASLMASTKSEIYTDNESRSIVLGIDESDKQTRRIIDYTNKLRAGIIQKSGQEKAKHLLRNCLRVLQSKPVINPFAHQITLPIEAKMLRRLNNQFQDFIAQITLLNQYQRELRTNPETQEQYLVSTKEDVAQAVSIFFTSIMFKVDELDSANRQLFERLKEYLLTTPEQEKHEFTRKEIRMALNLKKTKTGEFFHHLQELEYIYVSSGSANKGFYYTLEEWDEGLTKLKHTIQQDLHDQLATLKEKETDR